MTGMAVHMHQKMKKRTSAFAKGCNVVMGGTAVAIWKWKIWPKHSWKIFANGVRWELPRDYRN